MSFFVGESFWTITSGIRASNLASLLHEIEDSSLLYPIQRDNHVYQKERREIEGRTARGRAATLVIDETEVHASGSREATHEEPQQRRDREGTPERAFQSLIVALQSVIGTMQSMEQRMDRYLGSQEEEPPRRRGEPHHQQRNRDNPESSSLHQIRGEEGGGPMGVVLGHMRKWQGFPRGGKVKKTSKDHVRMRRSGSNHGRLMRVSKPTSGYGGHSSRAT